MKNTNEKAERYVVSARIMKDIDLAYEKYKRECEYADCFMEPDRRAICKLARKDFDEVAAPLDGAIRAVEGNRCSARTIDALDIMEALHGVENRLHIRKIYLEGLEVDIDVNAQDFPGVYRGTPYSTQFSAVYKNGTWRITEIYRGTCCGKNCGHILHHTEESKAAIIRENTRW